jgi:hypothetical protein
MEASLMPETLPNGTSRFAYRPLRSWEMAPMIRLENPQRFDGLHADRVQWLVSAA